MDTEPIEQNTSADTPSGSTGRILSSASESNVVDNVIDVNSSMDHISEYKNEEITDNEAEEKENTSISNLAEQSSETQLDEIEITSEHAESQTEIEPQDHNTDQIDPHQSESEQTDNISNADSSPPQEVVPLSIEDPVQIKPEEDVVSLMDRHEHHAAGSVSERVAEFSDAESLHDTQIDRGERGESPEMSHPRFGTIRSNLKEWFNKRYIGGYRNKKSGVEYFHAETQTITPQEIRAQTSGLKCHRDTQTVFFRNRRIQTLKDTFTQMSKRGCFVSSEEDLEIDAGHYVTADEFHEIKVQKAIIIQCFVRSVFARRKVAKMRSERNQKMEAISEKEKRRVMLIERKRQKDLESRLHPKTVKDFEILYNGLENWRLQETNRINSLGYSEPARLAALADLLDQESALLQKIDRLKASAYEENREKAILKLLESMAAPKKWPCSDATVVLVDTPNTIRARELRDLYHALNLPLLSIDERLQILLHVKYTVKEFDCNLTREIVELIDREGDLVSRGRDTGSLEGLRKRISTLFLQFIKTPEFNPEAAQYQKFPHAGQAWKRDTSVYYCQGCTKYKPSTDFYLSTAMKHLGKCKDCTVKENFATHRKDDSAYGDMLKLIRIQEAIKRKSSGMPADVTYNAMALLQESDMRYLIDVIWNRKSAISGSRNMEELILTRWNQDGELSPWNCILLTKAEAATHDRQPDPDTFYAKDFWSKISQKHLLAKQHFGQLPVIAKYLKHHYKESHDGKLVLKSDIAVNA